MLTHQMIAVQAVRVLALAAEPETAADSWKKRVPGSSAAVPEQTKKAKEAVEIELKLEAELGVEVEQLLWPPTSAETPYWNSSAAP